MRKVWIDWCRNYERQNVNLCTVIANQLSDHHSFSTSLFVNFFKKIPCKASKLDLNLIRLRKSTFRNCFAMSAISHLNSIYTQQIKYTNENSFWNSKWILFKQSIISKIHRVRIELWSKLHWNVANIVENETQQISANTNLTATWFSNFQNYCDNESISIIFEALKCTHSALQLWLDEW